MKDAAAGECAIALSLTFKAVDLINEGSPLQILFFAEGAPYTPAGLSILSGHENRQAVKDVVNYFYSDIIDDYLSTYLPEQIKVGQVNTTPNSPHRHPLRRHVQQHPQREGGAAGQMDALTRGTDAPKLSVRDCCKRFTGAPCSTTSALTWRAANFSPCWGPPAAARRRSCESSRGWNRPTPGAF